MGASVETGSFAQNPVTEGWSPLDQELSYIWGKRSGLCSTKDFCQLEDGDQWLMWKHTSMVLSVSLVIFSLILFLISLGEDGVKFVQPMLLILTILAGIEALILRFFMTYSSLLSQLAPEQHALIASKYMFEQDTQRVLEIFRVNSLSNIEQLSLQDREEVVRKFLRRQQWGTTEFQGKQTGVFLIPQSKDNLRRIKASLDNFGLLPDDFR